MKKSLTLAFCIGFLCSIQAQTACQRATPIDCGQVILNCANGITNNAMNGLTYWCIYDSFGSGLIGRDTVFKLQVTETKTYRFVLEMLNGKDMDLILVRPGSFNTSCTFPNACSAANGGFSYEYNHHYGIYREVLDIRLDPNPTPYLLFVDSKEPGTALFNLRVDCDCRGIEASDDLPTGERIFCDNFENYVPDKVIEPQSTRWERRDSTLPDGKVVSAGFLGQGVQFKGIVGSSPEDHFLLRNRYSTSATAGQATGRYRVSWKMRVENGQKGYYAVEHVAPVTGSPVIFNDAYHVTFLETGVGELRAGAIGTAPIATFQYPAGAWMNVVQIIDLDANKAELWINDDFVKSWTFSIGSAGASTNLASVKFKADNNYDFKVDELCVWKAGSCAPSPGSTPVVENGVGYGSEAAARCALYTSLEWGGGRNICDYGGTFIHRSDRFVGKLDQSDIAPNLLRNDPCVVSAYNGTVPNPLYADIYIFYKDDDQAVQAILNDLSGGNNLKKFVFACSTPGPGGACVVGPKCLTEIVPDSGNFLPNTCDSFYYVVITSGIYDITYDLSILPDGLCGTDFEDITQPCGGSCVPLQYIDQVSTVSKFNAIGPGNAYESCYSGTRSYSGGEKVYRFVMEKPSVINFKLRGYSKVGMALYSVICAKECIAFAESKNPSNEATMNAALAEGVYYLIIDKDENDTARTFVLEYVCDNKSFFDLQSLISSGGKPGKTTQMHGTGAKVPPICLGCDLPSFGPEYYHHFILNNQNSLAPGDEIHFLFRDDSTQYLTGSEMLSYIWNGNNAQEFWLIKDYTDFITPPIPNALKCAYHENDSVFIYVTQTSNGNHLFRELKPEFVPPGTATATATNIYHAAETSQVNNFALGTSITWHISTTKIEASAIGGNRDFDFHSSIPWVVTELTDAPWLSISESSGTGGLSYKLRLNLQPNVSLLPRSTTLEFASTQRPDIYRLYLKVTQFPVCTPPQATLATFNSSLCEGDTVFLRANVGADPVTGASLAPLYDFVWKDANGNTVNSPITAPPDQFTAIRSTGTYTNTVEVTAKYCDGADTSSIQYSVAPPPNPPTPSSPTSFAICTGRPFPTFSLVNPPSGQIIQWFESATGGSPIAVGAVFMPSLYTTKTYYAGTAYANSDCASLSRVAFQLTVNPMPTFQITDKFCSPDHQFYQFNILTNGSNVTVNNVPKTGNAGVFPVNNLQIGSTAVVRIANQFCDTMFMVASPICICDVEVPGFVQNYDVCANAPAPAMSVSIQQANVSVNWYNAASGGTKLNATPANPFTPQVPYLNTYYAEAVNLLNGCTSPSRRAVQLNLLPLPTLVLLDTICNMTQDSFNLLVSTNGTDVNANFGVKSFSNGIYTFSKIPVTQAVTIIATAVNTCARSITVNPPNCPCLNVLKPVSNGDKTVCFGEPFPELSVQVAAHQSANWYLNNLPVAQGVVHFTPNQGGVYLVETYDSTLNCTSMAKTAVALTVYPEILFSTSPPECAYDRKTYSFDINAGANTAVSLNGQPLTGNAGIFNAGNIMTGLNADIVVTELSTTCSRSINISSPACPCVESIAPPGSIPGNNEDVCQGQPKMLSASVGNNQTVNWYNAQGALVFTGIAPFSPNTQTPGTFTYFAEAYNPVTDCYGPSQTAITFKVNPSPTAQISKSCQSQSQYTVTVSITNGNTLTADAGALTSGPNNTFIISDINLGSPLGLTLINTQTGCTATLTVSSPVNCDCALLGNIDAPIAGPIQQACTNHTVFPSVSATVTQPNVVIDWYDAAGNLLASAAPFYQPPSNLPAGLYTYYAEARNDLSQCISNTRTPVLLIVSDPPPLTLSSSCEPSFLTYQVSGQAEPGIEIGYSSGTYTQVAPGLFTISGINKGQPVTITATNLVTQCVSTETVLLSTCPCPTVNKPLSLGDKVMCQGDPTAPVLSVQVNNPGLETAYWYLAPTGGVPQGAPSASYQPSPPSSTTSYYAETRLLNGFCPSPTREKVTLEVKNRPQAFAGLDQTVCAGDTIALQGTTTGASSAYWISPAGQFLPDNGALNVKFVAPYGTPLVTLTLITADPNSPCPADSSSLVLSLLDAPLISIDSVYCSHDLQSYNVVFSSTTSTLTVQPVPATSLGNNRYLASNINLLQNLSITGSNMSTGCAKQLTVPAPVPCTCPTIAEPHSLLGTSIERCPDQGLPTIVLSVNQGLIVNWYNSANATIPFLTNALQYTPGAPSDFFVEAVDTVNGCRSSRLKISLMIKMAPVVFPGPNTAFCPGTSATLSADPGTGYTYLWSGGQTTQNITVQNPGTYYATVTLNGCNALDSFVVTQHPALAAAIQVVEPIHCFGFSNGSLQAVASGGTLPIVSYAWSNQSGLPTISGVGAGTYTVTLFDQAGCSSSSSYTLTAPAPLSIADIQIDNPGPGQSNGMIAVQISGGTPPFTYQWYKMDTLLTGQTQPVLDSIPMGQYWVAVTDAFGCTLNGSLIQLMTTDVPELDFVKGIWVFPNPTSGQLTVKISLTEPADVAVQVMDVYGRALQKGNASKIMEGALAFDLAAYPEGLYWLKINLGEHLMVKKVAVNR